MKYLKFQYQLSIQLDKDIHHHYFTLKCLPKTENGQNVIQLKTRINADYYSISQDSFSNKMIYGYKEDPHQSLHIFIQGKVATHPYPYEDEYLLPVYKLATKQTKISQEMIDFLSQLDIKENRKDMWLLMNRIHEYMTYQKNVTDTNTTASDAFHLRKGVCQDYAHIMIAMLRYLHIPCRYVAGIMENENYTHAWVEVYFEHLWYGFDPTNNVAIHDSYIVFARGRDAKDTLVNKGIYYGNCTSQKQSVNIVVEEYYD